MNLNNRNSDNQIIDANIERTARLKFIIISILLVLAMFATVILSSILHKILFNEILQLNQQYYGLPTILLWLPFFLFSATVTTLSFVLSYTLKKQEKNDSKKTTFNDTLMELRSPSKKARRIIYLFRILLILSLLTLITSQLFLYLGIAYLI